MLFAAFRGEKDKIMSKRFTLVMVVLLVMPALLTACSTESRDTAEDYVKAVMKGDADEAKNLACDSFQEGTEALLAFYAGLEIDEDSLDLKFDPGKGNNQKEVIVTGSFEYGEDGDEFELAGTVRVRDLPRTVMVREAEDEEEEEDGTRKVDTRLVLEMEEDDDWCVAAVDMNDVLLEAEDAPADESEDMSEDESESDDS